MNESTESCPPNGFLPAVPGSLEKGEGKAGEIWGCAQWDQGISSRAVLDGRGFLLVGEMAGEMGRAGNPRSGGPICPALLWTLGKVTDLSELLSPSVDIAMVIRVMLKIKRDNTLKGSAYCTFSSPPFGVSCISWMSVQLDESLGPSLLELQIPGYGAWTPCRSRGSHRVI